MRRTAIGMFAIAAMSLLVAQAFAGGGARSNVVIDNYHAEGDQAVFAGVVESPRRACEKGRDVQVFGYNPGQPRRSLGTDRTGRNGRFAVPEQIPFFESFAYARAKRERLPSGRICRADRSEDISTAG